jgi:hypothetical protein
MPFNKIPLDADASAKLASITALYNSLESALMLRLADCREKSLTITNIEQSYLWLEKTIEREQLERNFRTMKTEIEQTKMDSTPIPMQPPLSPHAAILAESKAKLDGLAASIKELTDTVVTTGFSLKG